MARRETGFRVLGQRAGEREALLLAAGQPARRAVGETDNPTSSSNSADARCALARAACLRRRAHRAMLPAALRRSMAGRWNTMARRIGGDLLAAAPGDAAARSGGSNPMRARSSVVLPEPFGPIRTVGAPGGAERDAVENRDAARGD